MTDPAGLLTPLLMFVTSLFSPAPQPAPPPLALVTSLLPPGPPPAPPPAVAVVDADTAARRVLECVGRFESNGNYMAVSKSGTNRGKYQMTTHFFTQYGGDPQYAGKHEQAPPEMQDRVAFNGYNARGLDPWPGAKKVCGGG